MTRDPSALNFADRLAFWACLLEIAVREFVETPPMWARIVFFTAVFAVVAADLIAVILLWP